MHLSSACHYKHIHARASILYGASYVIARDKGARGLDQVACHLGFHDTSLFSPHDFPRPLVTRNPKSHRQKSSSPLFLANEISWLQGLVIHHASPTQGDSPNTCYLRPDPVSRSLSTFSGFGVWVSLAQRQEKKKGGVIFLSSFSRRRRCHISSYRSF